MNIQSVKSLPIPDKLAALPTVFIEPYGPLVRGSDVAAAFGVKSSTLRTWRSKGRFPEVTYPTPTVSYYRVADLVMPFYREFPGLLPDDPVSAMGRFLAVAMETGGGENEALSNGAEAVAPRFEPVTLSQALRSELVGIVSEAVAGLVEKEPESPAVIEALASEIAVQRQEIERLRAEARNAEQVAKEASQWRSKSFWDRLLKR